jgi:Tfp pilus assembly protein PilO
MDIIDNETRRFGRLLHYAGVLATVVCATAGHSLLHAPLTKRISATSDRIQELRLSVENAPVIREQHRNVSQKLHEVTTRIAEVQRRVPQQADAGEFLKEVTRLAGAEHLAIKDFRPEQPESRDGYAQLQVSLKGAGSYASICTFVEKLAKLKRLSKIKDLSLTAGDESTEYPMTATLVIYFGLSGKEAVTRGSVMRGSPDPAFGGAVGRPATTAVGNPATTLNSAVGSPATTEGERRG